MHCKRMIRRRVQLHRVQQLSQTSALFARQQLQPRCEVLGANCLPRKEGLTQKSTRGVGPRTGSEPSRSVGPLWRGKGLLLSEKIERGAEMARESVGQRFPRAIHAEEVRRQWLIECNNVVTIRVDVIFTCKNHGNVAPTYFRTGGANQAHNSAAPGGSKL